MRALKRVSWDCELNSKELVLGLVVKIKIQIGVQFTFNLFHAQ